METVLISYTIYTSKERRTKMMADFRMKQNKVVKHGGMVGIVFVVPFILGDKYRHRLKS